jgi:hypothetical protein
MKLLNLFPSRTINPLQIVLMEEDFPFCNRTGAPYAGPSLTSIRMSTGEWFTINMPFADAKAMWEDALK